MRGPELGKSYALDFRALRPQCLNRDFEQMSVSGVATPRNQRKQGLRRKPRSFFYLALLAQ